MHGSTVPRRRVQVYEPVTDIEEGQREEQTLLSEIADIDTDLKNRLPEDFPTTESYARWHESATAALEVRQRRVGFIRHVIAKVHRTNRLEFRNTLGELLATRIARMPDVQPAELDSMEALRAHIEVLDQRLVRLKALQTNNEVRRLDGTEMLAVEREIWQVYVTSRYIHCLHMLQRTKWELHRRQAADPNDTMTNDIALLFAAQSVIDGLIEHGAVVQGKYAKSAVKAIADRLRYLDV